MSFLWQQISNQGSCNKINARIFLGLCKILKLISPENLSKEYQDEVKAWLFDLSNILIQAEGIALKIICEHKDAEQKFFNSKESLPSILSLEEVHLFLLRSDIVFKYLQKILSILWDKKYKGSNMDKVLDDLDKILPIDHDILKIIKRYQPWCKIINNLRVESAHPNSPDSLTINYRIDIKGNLVRPRFIDYGHNKVNKGFIIYDFLKDSLQYQLLFCEELILYSLLEHLSNQFELVEIPENKRNIEQPERFKIYFSEINKEKN